MTDPLIARADDHDYQNLFIKDLNWSAPNHPPITYEQDGRHVTAINVSTYKGLRVWAINQKPDSKLEAAVDHLIAKTTTDRIVIFYDENEQVWRWPVRRNAGNTTTTRLTRHRHRAGTPDLKFAAKLNAIRLPLDVSLDPNAVLAKVRSAFDVETQNETRHASKLMARLYTAMDKAYPTTVDRATKDHQISVTLARILFLMFGDDTDMWPQDLFRDYVHEYTAPDGSDVGARLEVLFAYLDTPDVARVGPTPELEGFRYVNGRIFSERVRLPVINAEFRKVILEACDRDWSTISPAIFGSMFQSVRDAATRRELGEHYTSEENILRTLNPLFLDELRADFEHVKTLGKYEADRLRKLQTKLGQVRYLDPACGCGNFIIIAYRELRDLELAILERLRDLPSGEKTTQLFANEGLQVTLDHFYGIEIDEWPARIAETAMFLIDRQCDLKLTNSLGWAPDRLPIQEQATIVVGNAIRLNWSQVVPASDTLVVAGNPPFIGQYLKTDQQTEDIQWAWGKDYDGYLDYVTTWHAKASRYLRSTRAVWAFVTTNSVTQGQAVPALFGPLQRDGWRIKFAHRTFPWASDAAGKAAVHCVIIGFTTDPASRPRLFTHDSSGPPPREESPWNINAYLLEGADLLVDKRMSPLPGLPMVRKGSQPTDGGYLQVRLSDYAAVLRDPVAAKYLRPFIGAEELLGGGERWCLWLAEMDSQDLSESPLLTQRIAAVREMRLASAKAATRQAATTPHLFTEIRQPSGPYLALPSHVTETRRYFTAARYTADVICGNANFTAADPDGYLFAVISSSMFITWQRMIGGRIKSDLRFSNTVVWNNLPLPETNLATREAIIRAGADVLAARELHPERTLEQHYEPGGMTGELIAAHDALDQLLDQAFGAKAICQSERERQQILFDRFEELTLPVGARSASSRIRR